MWTTRKTARPTRADGETGPLAARGLSPEHRIFLAGVLLGLVLAKVAGDLLALELEALRFVFVPLSALAGGLAASGAGILFAGVFEAGTRRRRVRAVLAALGLSLAVLLGLYSRFVVRVDYAGHTRSVAFLVSWSRSPAVACSGDDLSCIKALGFDLATIRSAWSGRWAVELALALAYLSTLGGAGALAGLLMAPRRQPVGSPCSPGSDAYLDFDLWIDRGVESGYRAKAWSTAGFEATVRFDLPAGLEGGEPCRFGFTDPSRGGASTGALAGAAAGAAPEEAGEELYRAVFQGDLLKAFQGCLERSRQGPGVRIRLRLNDVPALARLPWEYLYDAGGRGFLALSARTPVVRYLELAEGLETLQVEPPLRVLAVISTPQGYQELAEADEEWRRLVAALEPLRASGRIEVERLERPTRAALERRLCDGGAVHVLHFVGHGGFSELRGEGMLVFEDEEGRGAPLPGQSLAYLLQDHPSLRLAVLNACNGARASRDDAFAGTAQVLVQHGVPAVVAMQSEVTDGTACRFAEKFYRALAAGLPVDACVGEVRQALAAESNPEWGTPVLYLRAADGRLFGLAETS